MSVGEAPPAATTDTPLDRIGAALEVAERFGGIDGAHHKSWVIDQMVRALLGCEAQHVTAEYDDWVRSVRAGEDGPETYDWDEGVPP